MAIMRLNIDQQLAQIGVRSTPAKMNISMPRMQMRIQTETPTLTINRKAPSFRVNRQKINNESGLKSPLELAKTFRNSGRQSALRGTGQAKNDGNFIANPKIPGDKSIPLLARNKAMSKLQKSETNIGLMPQSLPEINWEKGQMNMSWSKHKVAIDWDGEYMPQMTVDPMYSVEVFLRTKPHFRITVEETFDPGATGRYINSAI